VVGEVLKLNQYAGKDIARRINELIDQLVVLAAAQPVLTQTDVVRILQQLLVVRAHVQHHRQAQLRMHAGARGIEREFAHRDAHAVGSQVT
jgi:hypothetical protein